MNIFLELHNNMPREGPGDMASTTKALSLIPNLPKNPQILDIGCGPGMQTLALAQITKGQITAIDNHQPFLDELQQRAAQENLSSHIITQNCSMFSLDFQPESFDLIWSEGAIYIMGFQEGLQSWHRFLKTGGSIAVTELSWLVTNPPEEPLNFWKNAYPAMKNITENITIIQNLGYNYINSFTLPESSWWDDYYTPLEGRISNFRQKYQGNEEANAVLDEEQREIQLYRKYSDSYGYVFYLMQKYGAASC
ncbi:class I SAM-dependent methyltransferase [Aerosakkonemataceae cyanobacterium BLCC-F154]|uniref:Class I SAM-dependent methyltransferase n=1 Tax=Floridaenema fluviatile BLCC-F154 TaxID=3153640 RepID=A0ABV4YAI9_9CYAN